MTAVLLILGLTFCALSAYFGIPWIVMKSVGRRLFRHVEACSCVCFTFDDGPDPENTAEILRTLESAGVKATFFFLGRAAEMYPAAAAAVAAAGHEIGEHGYGHRNPWKVDPVTALVDLLRGARAVAPYRTPGARPLLRPPYGKLNLVTLLYCLLTRRRIIHWNVDPRDYKTDDVALVARTVQDQLRPGSVVLLHDARIRPNLSRPDVTAKALACVLATAEARANTMATIGDALSRVPHAPVENTAKMREAVGRTTR